MQLNNMQISPQTHNTQFIKSQFASDIFINHSLMLKEDCHLLKCFKHS
jgi:hypothetical protein